MFEFTKSKKNKRETPEERNNQMIQKFFKNISSEPEIITPSTAEKYLSRNINNRPKRTVHQLFLEKNMEEGWLVNGETIKFDKDGNLIDGQHRLAACIITNKSFPTFVVRGLNREVFPTIDTGKVRSASDTIAVEGHINYNALAGTLRVLASIKNEKQWIRCDLSRSKFTNREYLQILDREPGILDSLAFVITFRRITGIPVTLSASMHYIFSKINANDADYFWDKILTGVGLEATSPMLILRNRLIADIHGTNRSKVEKMELCVKAWNHFRANAAITKLQLTGRIPMPE